FMSADNFYWYASVLIFLPWLLLILAPNGRYTEPIAFGSAVILLIAAAVFTFLYLTGPDVEGGFFSLTGFENLFRSKQMLLTGWLNYLSFCLLVGLWQSHDARQVNIGHLFVIPCLLLTMLTGPAGLLLYLMIRFFKTRKWDIR
ncbi:MAG TPA: ABA4-like family protein, partial [Saprospiraceae bacterium]|nr:ABA4-like family protein [Saprospiraceae bacterium]